MRAGAASIRSTMIAVALVSAVSLANGAERPGTATRPFTAAEITASKVGFSTTEDRFTGRWERRLAKQVTMKAGRGMLSKPVVMFDLVRMRSSSGDTLTFMQLGTLDSEWAFYDGRVLMILDGGARISLPNEAIDPIKPKREVLGSGTVYEGLNVPLTSADLDAIGQSFSIEARLVGERKSVELTFSRDGVAAFHLLREEQRTFETTWPDSTTLKH